MTTLIIKTLGIKGLFVKFSVATLCHYAECRVSFIVMLNVAMLNVVMLGVVALARLIPQTQNK
jgi:hypothetical protein